MEAIQKFRLAMAQDGIESDATIIGDEKLHRFHVGGDSNGTLNGWYVLYLEPFPHGVYGCWKRYPNEALKWSAKPECEMSQEEKSNYNATVLAAKEKLIQIKAEVHLAAQEIANRIWSEAKPANANHPYLLKKNINPNGARISKNGELIIPICDTQKNIHSLQFISGDGHKMFLKDGAVNGYYFSIGKATETIYLTEGFATASSVHQATSCGVVVAFHCGNLLGVAEAIRQKFSASKLIIAADNDAWSSGNPGLTKAHEAAKKAGAAVVFPTFDCIDSKPTDFNDLMVLEGIDEVRRQLCKVKVVKEKLEDSVTRLLKLPFAHYEQVRKAEANSLGIRVSILDQLVTQNRHQPHKTETDDELENGITVWDKPVNGEEIAQELMALFRRHVILAEEQIATIVLWVFGSYCLDAFNIFPKLLITSPTKRCGKTTIMKILNCVAHRALIASNLSAAVIFRSVDLWKPTLLIDEADTYISGDDCLRGIINSGHSKETAFVLRVEGDSSNRVPKRFSTWSPMAIAMIKKPADTILDRSIVINLRRKLPAEHADKWLIDGYQQLKTLRQKLKRWANDKFETIKNLRPILPNIKNDRAVDNWQPLFAIAESINLEFLKRTETAMHKLCGTEDDESLDTLLLSDIKSVFESISVEKVHANVLVDNLVSLEDRPWSEHHNGKPLSKNGLAKILKSFEIKSKQLWINGINKNGYELLDFADAFIRYIPSVPPVTNSRTLEPNAGVAPSRFANSRLEFA